LQEVGSSFPTFVWRACELTSCAVFDNPLFQTYGVLAEIGRLHVEPLLVGTVLQWSVDDKHPKTDMPPSQTVSVHKRHDG
jgi:hypothetical protein